MRDLENLLIGSLLEFGGLHITESPHLVIGPFEDWSDVRSPGRARRRRKMGHPQRIRYFYKPDPNLYRYDPRASLYPPNMTVGPPTLVGHPETIAQLRAAIRERVPQ